MSHSSRQEKLTTSTSVRDSGSLSLSLSLSLCSSVVRAFAHGAICCRIDPSWVDPLSYFSVQPVFHDWCNKGCGMCYHVDGAYKRAFVVNRKE